MSHFFGRRFSSGSGGDGYNDHSLLIHLDVDDHLQYLITTAIRSLAAPTSGLNKTGSSAGDVFTLQNAGTGAALFIRQTGSTTTADAALDIDNTDNVGRGLAVFSSTPDPDLPLVQFSALNESFDQAVLSVTHANPCGLALQVLGDAYFACQIEVASGIVMHVNETNPFTTGEAGIYVKGNSSSPGEFYFVDQTGAERTWTVDTVGDGSGGTVTGDGYFPFIEVDELTMSGLGSGTVANTSGSASTGSIIRRAYNDFLIGIGDLEIKGLTLRTTIDNVLTPQVTFSVVRNPTIIDDGQSRTIFTGGTVLAEDVATTETETFISGNRKDGEIQFTTGALDMGLYGDGYLLFVFEGDHTLDSKSILIERRTAGPFITDIEFEYPICAFTGTQQTSVRVGQTFDVTVRTSLDFDAYSQATSVQVDAGDAADATVMLTETFSGSGIWTGTITARTGQGNGYADINATAYDSIANTNSENTSTVGDALVLFDNDFPIIESFEEGSDLIYPPGQTCLKFGEYVDAYMDVTDFTEILYTSPNGRFTIPSPTVYNVNKQITWDLGASGIEENPGGAGLTVTNFRIRARKASNCSETTRDIQIRLDDTPPRITSIRWRRNNTGAYNLTSPVLSVGTHGVRIIFDDPLVEIPELVLLDGNKGILSAFSGSVPTDTFTATLTITDPPDINGCTELVLATALNCSHKLPLDADPIDNTDEEYCVDVVEPLIVRVEIDVDLIDGYWNDSYDGYNAMDDDSDNSDNTAQACEHNFSSGVMSITAPDILTRHGENVYVTVEMGSTIETGDTCAFDASPWGASSSTSVPQLDGLLYQGPFVTALGSTRNDDQARAIGRASTFHATGGNATVTDLALNTDTAANIDILSANGIDNIATEISFTSDGTTGGVFQVSSDSFRAFVIGRRIRIVDNNSTAIFRTVVGSEIDGSNGTIFCDGGSLSQFTVAQSARAVPLSVTDAEVQAWNTNRGLIAYVNDGAFTNLTLVDFANPEAFSQHLTDDQLTQNNTGTVGVNLFRANFWGSKISVPNTGGGTEANPTGTASSKYVWRSKRIRLTTNPTGVQGTTLRFMVFGFAAGTSYRNVNITATTDWDQNSSRFDLGTNDSQIDIRISVDDPFASTPPYTNANWFKTTDFEVSPQSGFKFGSNKDINLVFSAPSTDLIFKDMYIEVTLTTNVSGKAPQLDMIGLAYLT